MGARIRAPTLFIDYCASLEHQSQTVLNFATIVCNQLRRNLAEICAGEIHSRIRQLHPVEQIVGLDAHLQFEALSYVERFAECAISLPDSWPIQPGIGPRIIATMQVWRQRRIR